MTHYTRNYKGLTREEADNQAILDIKDYLGERSHAWEIVLVECGKAEALGTAEAFQSIAMSLEIFAGISGYPIHALGRRFCSTAYRAWMASEVGGGSVPLGEDNFPTPYEED